MTPGAREVVLGTLLASTLPHRGLYRENYKRTKGGGGGGGGGRTEARARKEIQKFGQF